VKAEEPDLKSPDVMKELGRRWRELDEAGRQPFHDMAEKDKVRGVSHKKGQRVRLLTRGSHMKGSVGGRWRDAADRKPLHGTAEKGEVRREVVCSEKQVKQNMLPAHGGEGHGAPNALRQRGNHDFSTKAAIGSVMVLQAAAGALSCHWLLDESMT